MTNWTFSLAPSVISDPAITAATRNTILDLFEAAGEVWSRYLIPTGAVIEVTIYIDNLAGNTLAEAGPAGFEAVGAGVVSAGVTYEIREGVDINGAQHDASVTLNRVQLAQNRLYLDAAPFARTDPIPSGQYDLFSIILHELAHPLGFILGPSTNSEFAQFRNFTGQNFYYDGPAVISLAGAPVKLGSGPIK